MAIYGDGDGVWDGRRRGGDGLTPLPAHAKAWVRDVRLVKGHQRRLSACAIIYTTTSAS